MRAAIYRGRENVVIENIPDPPAPPEGKVLVRPLYVGLCGTDMHEYFDGPDLIDGAQILGHEFSAEVVVVGEGVHTMAPGDLVAVCPGAWCGTCEYCLSGRHPHCPEFAPVGLRHEWGGLAELAIVGASQLTVMPAGVSPIQAAVLEPTMVATKAYESASMSPGGRLLITGGGPVGTLTALVARAAGAGQVVVSEPNQRRRALIEELGFAAIDPADADALASTFDACVEASGHTAGLDLCIRSIEPGGTIVQVGIHSGTPPVDIALLTQKEARLVGTWCWPVTDWLRIARLVESGSLPIDSVVTAVMELEHVEEAIRALADREGVHQKVLIRVQGSAE